MKNDRVILAARGWIGTPFHHQASIKHVGCDCAGLIRGLGAELGVIPAHLENNPTMSKFRGYGRSPFKNMLGEACSMWLDEIASPEQGCILVMRFTVDPQHLAIYNLSGNTIIHSYQAIGKVAEHSLDETWRNRIHGYYKFRGLE